MHPERPTVVSLELTFNPGLEAQIRAEWQALADAGLSSLAGHTAPSNRPHITLAVRPSMPATERAELSSVVILPLPLTLGAPILFGSGDRRVLARSIVPTAPLLDLHAALHTLLASPHGDDGVDSPFMRPGQWVPHITLARRLRLDTLPQALRALDDVRPPEGHFPTEATTLRRWDAASATITDLLT
jgi:2'-5' RNA ligase